MVSRHHTQRDEIYYAVRMDTVTLSKNPFDHIMTKSSKKVPYVDLIEESLFSCFGIQSPWWCSFVSLMKNAVADK